MTRIPLVSYRRAGPELRSAYDRVAALWGFRASPPVALQIVQCFAHRPAYIEPVARGYHFVGWSGALPRTVRELVAVLVSRGNDCFY